MNFRAIKPSNCCSHSDLSNPVATTYWAGFCQGSGPLLKSGPSRKSTSHRARKHSPPDRVCAGGQNQKKKQPTTKNGRSTIA